MGRFRIDGDAGHVYEIRVTQAEKFEPELVRTLIDIDLQTFSESTYSEFTAAAFLRDGAVFLLWADGVIIGSCVCFRCWERPNEAKLLAMGIRPGWRGRGLGQRFVKGVLEKLRNRGLRSVVLTVPEDNRRALRVYEEVGFEVYEKSEEDSRTGEVSMYLRCKLSDNPELAPVPFPKTDEG